VTVITILSVVAGDDRAAIGGLSTVERRWPIRDGCPLPIGS
jgi:hypothetical protein